LSGLSSGPGKTLKHIHSIIHQYLKNKYSLIPVDHEKRPCIYWKKYQHQRAAAEEILKWHVQFETCNIGIVTGCISNLAVIDIDDLSLLPLLREKIPDIEQTARVKTARGYHYYFNLNGREVKSTNLLFGFPLELKSNGNYVIAPPSTINNHTYTYEVPLSEITPLPDAVCLHTDKAVPDRKIVKKKSFKIPKYHGTKVDCIRQILKRDIEEGERDNSLFILYNLLIQNRNTREYSRIITENKNLSLASPLTEPELKKIYRKSYKYGCSRIRERLPYIDCEHCDYRFKGGQLSDSNILIKSLRLLPELNNTQRSIICLLGTVFEGEYPSINQIAKVAKTNSNTVKKALNVLRERHIIDEYHYN
jgi:hypothetical protein